MITTVTLNTAIDKAYYMEQDISGGTVMRVGRVNNTAGGKGLNVARVIKQCGEKVLATGIAGGFNGKYLEYLLDQDEIPHAFFHVNHETRSCINILDGKFGSTEFLEPGFEISAQEEIAFLSHFQNQIEKSDLITISGSVPRGMSPTIYSQMVSMTKSRNRPIIVDTSGKNLLDVLRAQPTVIKPNQEELEAILNTKITSIQDAVHCANKLFLRGIPNVLISLGKEGALLVCEKGCFHGIPPQVIVANTVGCGDTMVGSFAVAILKKYSPSDALAYAVATATAGAMNERTGYFAPDVRDKIINQIIINKYRI